MKGERAPRRYPASAFPDITGVRLVSVGSPATLVNLSATGMLVACSSRVVPGSAQTVVFEGSFLPKSVECRVVRCEVTGIAADGALCFHVGLAFTSRIALPFDTAEDADDQPDSPAPAEAPAPSYSSEPRNRW